MPYFLDYKTLLFSSSLKLFLVIFFGRSTNTRRKGNLRRKKQDTSHLCCKRSPTLGNSFDLAWCWLGNPEWATLVVSATPHRNCTASHHKKTSKMPEGVCRLYPGVIYPKIVNNVNVAYDDVSFTIWKTQNIFPFTWKSGLGFGYGSHAEREFSWNLNGPLNTCTMALRLKAQTAEAAMLFLSGTKGGNQRNVWGRKSDTFQKETITQ